MSSPWPVLVLCLAACDDATPMPGGPPPPAVDASVSTLPPLSATPVRTCNVRDYGARGDGRTKDTAAIQAAIDDCARTGGGTVLLRGATYLSGMITLRSNITLRIEAGAVLLGTQDIADYPDTNPPTNNTQLGNCRKALVYAERAHDVRVEGGGVIDGNGNTPQWIGPSSVHPERTRPMAFYTALSHNVSLENVTIHNSAVWGLVNLEADGLTIRGVTVDSQLSGNRDGIDVVDCHHVLIENVDITSEDDSICIKSGSDMGVDDVTVRNSHVHKSIVANGLKFGTASFGSFTNVTFDTITVENVDKAAMAVESVDGATISNITYRNISVHNAGAPFFVLLGDRGNTPMGETHRVGSIDGVHFENISGDAAKYSWGSAISGTQLAGGTHKVRNVTFSNVHLSVKGGLGSVPADPPEYAGQYPDPNLWGNMSAAGLFIRHADGVTLTGTVLTPLATDARPTLVTRDVTGLTNN